MGEKYSTSLIEVAFSIRLKTGESVIRTHVVKHFWYHSWPDHGVPRLPDNSPDPSHILNMLADVAVYRASCAAKLKAELSMFSFLCYASFKPVRRFFFVLFFRSSFSLFVLFVHFIDIYISLNSVFNIPDNVPVGTKSASQKSGGPLVVHCRFVLLLVFIYIYVHLQRGSGPLGHYYCD